MDLICRSSEQSADLPVRWLIPVKAEDVSPSLPRQPFRIDQDTVAIENNRSVNHVDPPPLTGTVQRWLDPFRCNPTRETQSSPCANETGRSQPVSASFASESSRSSFSWGLSQPRVCRSRLSSSRATASRWSWEYTDRSVPLGKYWPRRALVCSFVPHFRPRATRTPGRARSATRGFDVGGDTPTVQGDAASARDPTRASALRRAARSPRARRAWRGHRPCRAP